MAQASGLVHITVTKATGELVDVAQASETTEAWVRTKPLGLLQAVDQTVEPGAGLLKFVDRLVFEMLGRNESENLVFYVYASDDLKDFDDEPPSAAKYGPYALGGAVGFVDLDPRIPASAWIAFEFRDDAVMDVWKMTAFEVWGDYGGNVY